MSNSKTFWAPMESQALVITLILAGLCMGFPIFYYNQVAEPTGQTILVCVLPIVIFLSLSLFAIKSYHLEDGVLRIKRTLWSTRVSLRPLESAEIQPGAMSSARLRCGISGLFGWIGSFRDNSLGDFQAWVTDRQKTVVLRSGGKTYVVSPLEPDQFLKALQPLKA